jgi:hypothetical protein
MKVQLIKQVPLWESQALILPLKITLMTQYQVSQEELSMPYFLLVHQKVRRLKLPLRCKNSGQMLLIPSFTKIGSVVLLEVSSSRVVFITVPLLKIS